MGAMKLSTATSHATFWASFSVLTQLYFCTRAQPLLSETIMRMMYEK